MSVFVSVMGLKVFGSFVFVPLSQSLSHFPCLPSPRVNSWAMFPGINVMLDFLKFFEKKLTYLSPTTQPISSAFLPLRFFFLY